MLRLTPFKTGSREELVTGPIIRVPRRRPRQGSSTPELRKIDVQDGVLLPLVEIEVPPLMLVNREAFPFHGGTKVVSKAARLAGPPLVAGARALAEFIVSAGHGNLFPTWRIAEGQVDGTPSVVLGPLRRVGHEVMLGGGSFHPEHARDPPGTVAVEDNERVTILLDCLLDPAKGLGSGSLQERSRLPVNGPAEKVAGRGVADIELNRGIDRGYFDEIGLAEVPSPPWGM